MPHIFVSCFVQENEIVRFGLIRFSCVSSTWLLKHFNEMGSPKKAYFVFLSQFIVSCIRQASQRASLLKTTTKRDHPRKASCELLSYIFVSCLALRRKAVMFWSTKFDCFDNTKLLKTSMKSASPKTLMKFCPMFLFLVYHWIEKYDRFMGVTQFFVILRTWKL